MVHSAGRVLRLDRVELDEDVPDEMLRAAGDTTWCMWARLNLAWAFFAPAGYMSVTVFDGGAVAAILWPSPVAWFALHRLRRESERACDDAVLRGEIERKTTLMVGALEPILTIGLAVAIAVILLAVYLPMFDMVNTVGR